MGNDVNACFFIGRVGKDPITRQLASGESVTNFSLAVGWKGKSDEGTLWLRCVAFGKLAEVVRKYSVKGTQIHVSASLRENKWMKDGVEVTTMEFVINNMQLLARPGGQSDSNAPEPKTVAPLDNGDIPF